VHAPAATGPTVYLKGGENLNATLERMEIAGGKIHLAKTFICDGLGYIAFFHDTEENRIGPHLQINDRCPDTMSIVASELIEYFNTLFRSSVEF
jgi:hypothetical protein